MPAGRSERSRASFEVFMRRLGQPETGTAILREMRGENGAAVDAELPFERLIFGGKNPDVALPPRGRGAGVPGLPCRGSHPVAQHRHARRSGCAGKSLATGAFMRVRERQELVISGWLMTYDDIRFFLDVRKMGVMPSLFIEAGDNGLIAERTRTRGSELRVRFGLEAEGRGAGGHRTSRRQQGLASKGRYGYLLQPRAHRRRGWLQPHGQ